MLLEFQSCVREGKDERGSWVWPGIKLDWKLCESNSIAIIQSFYLLVEEPGTFPVNCRTKSKPSTVKCTSPTNPIGLAYPHT